MCKNKRSNRQFNAPPLTVSQFRSRLLKALDDPSRLPDEKLLTIIADAEDFATNDLAASNGNGSIDNNETIRHPS